MNRAAEMNAFVAAVEHGGFSAAARELELTPAELDHACLLCSEPTPEHCHRRLVAEYLQREWKNVEIRHL